MKEIVSRLLEHLDPSAKYIITVRQETYIQIIAKKSIILEVHRVQAGISSVWKEVKMDADYQIPSEQLEKGVFLKLLIELYDNKSISDSSQ